MNPHRRWTQTDITTLRDLLQQGRPVADVAARLHRNPEEVSSMMRRLRLRLMPPPVSLE
jgi:Mn-dependent DtxR family transcriptional regulator